MRSFVYILFLLVFIACVRSNKIQIKSEPFPSEDIFLGKWSAGINKDRIVQGRFAGENIFPAGFADRLDSISSCLDSVKTNAAFRKIYSLWTEISQFELENEQLLFYSEDYGTINNWFNLNYELLKITGEIKFADEIEKLLHDPKSGYVIGEELLKKVALTKKDDQVYVNLPVAFSAHYKHTTGGTILISQETNYPLDGHIHIRFETSDKRFVELFIRIPSWAGEASVTVGGVKYKAAPGEYCRVARMWKNGDEAEVLLLNTKIPVL